MSVEPAPSTSEISFDVVNGVVGAMSYQLPPRVNLLTKQIETPPIEVGGQPPIAGGALRFTVTTCPAQSATDSRIFGFDVATIVELVPDGISVDRLTQLAMEAGFDLAPPVAVARVSLATGGEVTVPTRVIRSLADRGRIVGAVRVYSRITGARVGRGLAQFPTAPVDGAYVIQVRNV